MIQGRLGAVVIPSLCHQDFVGGVVRGEGGTSKGEGKDHVVESPLSSSFICLSLLQPHVKETGSPCVSNLKCPSRNIQFLLHTLGALDLVQGSRNCHLFIG